MFKLFIAVLGALRLSFISICFADVLITVTPLSPYDGVIFFCFLLQLLRRYDHSDRVEKSFFNSSFL